MFSVLICWTGKTDLKKKKKRTAFYINNKKTEKSLSKDVQETVG